ncbi:MAG TPA: 4Fe-4S binding protein [Treponemataceae bacterium]|nr:4Fe-4S binding protein [Treponemataceae bacterium]
MSKKSTSIQKVRRITLGILLAGLTVLAMLHQKLQGIPAIDALDPFGGLETLMKFIAGGEYVKRIEPGNIVLFGGIVVLGVALSRFFCGWLCAFGALQGVFGWIGKKLLRRRFIVPQRIDGILRWLKYPLLVIIIALTWSAGELVIRAYDPLAAFAHLWTGPDELFSEFAVGMVILAVVMILSAFFERVFCKYLCPLGAVNAILGRIPFFRIRRSQSTCVSCKKCDNICPMNVNVSVSGTVGSAECIACLECVTACPTKPNSLEATLGGKVVRPGAIVGLGFAIFLAAALIGQATGMLHFVAPTLQAKSEKGTLKVEDIKGSSTYESVAESFGINLDLLYREVGIDRKTVPPSTMLKDTGKIAGIEEFEADTVRIAVAKILGVPYAGERPSGDESLPLVPSDFALEGTMTIAEVASALHWTTAAVIAKLGLPTGIPVDRPLRDLKDQYGFSMPTLKEKIRE